MRVVVTQELPTAELERMQEAGLEVVGPLAAGPPARDVLLGALAGADALVCLLTDQVDEELLDVAPRLRVVANVAVGYDNVDVAAAAARGVVVTNTPGVLTDATADLTFALLLAVARRIPEADAAVRAGRFPRWGLFQELLGLEVTGAQIGIVGLGRIGGAVAARASLGFGMQVRYVGGRPDPSARWAGDAREVCWDELLAESDYVTLHAPLTEQTRHLVDAAALARMKPSAVLINTARGPLVDERALAKALAAGRLAGAGLDVFEREPEIEAALLATRRTVLTPHVGSATAATRRRMAALAVDNVLAVAAGRPPPTPVAVRPGRPSG